MGLARMNPINPALQKNVMENIAKDAESEAQKSLSKIFEIARSVDAVDLFVALSANMAFGPGDYISEATHGNVPAKMELFAYYIFPFFGERKESLITPWETQHCWETLDKLFISRMHQKMFSETREQKPGELDHLSRSIRLTTEIVRGSAYPEQTKEEILSIQGKFDAWFAKRVGISPSRAVDLLWAIIKTQEDSANGFIGYVLAGRDAYANLWKAAKRKPHHQRDDVEQQIISVCADRQTAGIFGFVKHLNELSPSKIPVSLSTIKFLDPLPTLEEWSALCELIGLTVEKREKMSDPVEVRQRPLFVLPDNRVLLIDISNALDCLWESFEKIARTDQSFFDRQYQRRKTEWLESKIFELLKKLFPAKQIYHHLSYPDPDKPNGATAELDFAILWPPFIVLVEAKARQFRIESQLGDTGRLRSDIKANIEDAFKQAKRARRYIDGTDKPEFIEIGTGRKLTFEKKGIYRTYLLTVSQHHLAGLVNHFAELKELGLFREGEYPLSICLADLEMIMGHAIGPDVFLHYIEKRIEILHDPVEVMADELDFFGAYLSCRLRADRIGKKGVDFVSLGGWSEKFDALMAYRRGERDHAPVIELEVPSEIKNILLELRRRTDDPGARWIAVSLLGMSDAALQAVAQSIEEIRVATLTSGMFRSLSFQDGDTVISIVASLDLPAGMLRERTNLKTAMEKYRRKVKKSIGIGIMVADSEKPFDCATWVEGPWKYDEKIEEALKTEPKINPVRGQKLPGRNEPCFCGSEKKFKKCCLPRIRTR